VRLTCKAQKKKKRKDTLQGERDNCEFGVETKERRAAGESAHYSTGLHTHEAGEVEREREERG